MKFKMLKKLIPAIALLALLATISSCNRGVGCPTFSIDESVTQVEEVNTTVVTAE
jgi:hypothetical protein